LVLRAKLISTINYVDKGQNKGQLRDVSLFFEKRYFSINNYVEKVLQPSLFSATTMLNSNATKNHNLKPFFEFSVNYW